MLLIRHVLDTLSEDHLYQDYSPSHIQHNGGIAHKSNAMGSNELVRSM